MISRDVTIQNNVGLHARPATFFIQKANSFKSSIWVEKEERRVKGTTITLIADGSDEEEALEGLTTLINTGFSE